MSKKIYLNFFIIFLSLIFILPTLHSAKLSSFDILIDIKSPTKAYITEVWDVEYDSTILNDKALFKEKIILANLDLDLFAAIDKNIRPKIFIKSFSNASIIFDETKDQININYEISDDMLTNFYETDSEIVWKFNEALMNCFVEKNLYIIPSYSKLTISAYGPLIVESTNPKGSIFKNEVVFNSFSSNEFKVLYYEKKPPKPSFLIISSENSNIFYYLIIIFVVLSLIFLLFKKQIEKSILKFVIRFSEIKPKKPKKEISIEQEFFDD